MNDQELDDLRIKTLSPLAKEVFEVLEFHNEDEGERYKIFQANLMLCSKISQLEKPLDDGRILQEAWRIVRGLKAKNDIGKYWIEKGESALGWLVCAFKLGSVFPEK